jgi:hypothetical protein
MSDRETVISRSAELEKILDKLGAEGTGLGQKTLSLQHLFTPQLSEKLKFIGAIRNKAAHEVSFRLHRPEQFISACDEAKVMLNSLSNNAGNRSSYQTSSDHTGYTRNARDFSIPPNLVTFNCTIIPVLQSTTITLSSLTGRVIKVKERTYTTTSGKVSTTTQEQKFWLSLSNTKEEYVELINFGLQAREGHLLTILYGARHGKTAYAAIYINELNRYFWQERYLNGLLFGGHMFLGKAFLYLVWMCTGALILTGLLASIGMNFLVGFLISFVLLPFAAMVRSNSVIRTRFKAHLAKIFS